jgi:tetratricopeptide (TPR) repeat protein
MRRRRIFLKFIFLQLIWTSLIAQTVRLDSLKKILSFAKHDTIRLRTLVLIVEDNENDAWPVDNEKVKILAEKCLSGNPGPQLKKIYQDYLATAFHNMSVLAQKQNDRRASITFQEKALKIREEAGDARGAAFCLNEIGLLYDRIGEYPKAIQAYKKSLEYSRQINDMGSAANTLNNMGVIKIRQGNLQEALDVFIESLSYKKHIDDISIIANIYGNISAVYIQQGSIEKALEYCHKSLRIYEENNIIGGMANMYNTIADIYLKQEDYSKAEEHLRKSLKLAQKAGDKKMIAMYQYNLGAVFSYSNKYDIALEFFNRSLTLRQETGDVNGIAYSLNSIGQVYIKQGDFKKALENYEKSSQLLGQQGDINGLVLTLVNSSDAYFLKKDFPQAEIYARKALKHSQEIGYPTLIKNSAKSLFNACRAQHKDKEAFEMFALHIQMRDSLNNSQLRKLSIREQFRYEYEKKAAADSIKTAEERKVAAAMIKHEQSQRYILYTGLSLIALFGVFMFNRYRLTQKQRNLIEIQKSQVEMQQSISEQQKQLVVEKQKELLDSIRYANRIQQSLLTSEKYIAKSLSKLKKA